MVTTSFAPKAKEIFKGAALAALIEFLDRKTFHILHGHKIDEIDRIGFYQIFEGIENVGDGELLEQVVLLRTYFNNCIGGLIKVTQAQQVQFDIVVKLVKDLTENAITRRIKCNRPSPDCQPIDSNHQSDTGYDAGLFDEASSRAT